MTNSNFHQEINSRIFIQSQHLLEWVKLSEEENSRFFCITLDIALKLQAMAYHLKNYEQFDEEYKKSALSNYKEFPNTVNNCCSLIYELEAYLYQLKSSLDMVIKIMGILFPNHFKTNTFGKNGDHLIKNLEKFKENNSNHIEQIDYIIDMVKNDQDVWIRKAVELRNTITHYKSMRFFGYSVNEINGDISVKKPKVLNMDPLIFMRATFSNCLEFIQDLISFSIALSLPSGFCLSKPSVLPPSWQAEGIDKYIKYSVGIKKEKVIIKNKDNAYTGSV
ncbi:Cthe-2314-like HEPN domain-containing protein [Candidatus Electrothrix gigas]